MTRVAIVTGASVGLGREFALQLDALGEVDEIWLIARRADLLSQVAGELRKTRGRVMAVDLTVQAQVDGLVATLEQERPEVRWLVNNAGFGHVGPVAAEQAGTYARMIALNITSLVDLTARVLPFCPRGARIVQVGSSAGFKPMPNMAVYSATKAFVNSFSLALHHELADRGVTVTAVCPGPVETEFFQVATAQHGKQPPGPPAAKASDVVALAIRDARNGRAVSVYGVLIKFYHWIHPLLPTHAAAWAIKRTRLT